MADDDDKNEIQKQLDQLEKNSAASRESTSESQVVLDEIEAKLKSIQGALDQIKSMQGSQRATEETHKTKASKVLKAYQEKKDRKKTEN